MEDSRLPDSGFMGEGHMPSDMERVNWAAYAFAPLWAFVYGPRRWRWAMLGPLLLSIVIDNIALLFFDSKTVYPAVSSVTGTVISFGYPALAAWYSTRVDEAVWHDRASRFAANPQDFARALRLDSYRFWRRLWTIVFLGLVAFYVAVAVYLAFTDPGQLVSSIWLALVLTALFVIDRRRRAERREQSLQPDASASVHNAGE